MTKESVLSILRHLLTFGGGFAANAGYATGDEITTGVSAVIALVGVVWGVVEKVRR